MRKIIVSLKPFIIFQICFVLLSLLLIWFGPSAAISAIIGYGFFFPIIYGGIYIIGFIFGVWAEIRNKGNILVLFLITMITLIVNYLVWLPQYNNQTNYLISLTIQESVSFFVGQIIVFIYKLFARKII